MRENAGFGHTGRHARAARLGLRPGPHQGALPPGPPPPGTSARGQAPAAASGLHDWEWLRGRGRVGEAKGRRPACRTAPLRLAHPPPPPPHTPSEGFQGLCPWRGSKGQRPLAGSGAEPRPCCVHATACVADHILGTSKGVTKRHVGDKFPTHWAASLCPLERPRRASMENGFRRIALAQGLLPMTPAPPVAPADPRPPSEADKPAIREPAGRAA